jgi:hypothetical protein
MEQTAVNDRGRAIVFDETSRNDEVAGLSADQGAQDETKDLSCKWIVVHHI